MSAFISETYWASGERGIYVRIGGFQRLEEARRFGSTRARLRRDQGHIYIEDATGRSSTRVRDCELSIVRRNKAVDALAEGSSNDDETQAIGDDGVWPEIVGFSLVAHIVRAETNPFLLSELL